VSFCDFLTNYDSIILTESLFLALEIRSVTDELNHCSWTLEIRCVTNYEKKNKRKMQ
jgi:hypothetical protein